jgi:hypothetical protein
MEDGFEFYVLELVSNRNQKIVLRGVYVGKYCDQPLGGQLIFVFTENEKSVTFAGDIDEKYDYHGPSVKLNPKKIRVGFEETYYDPYSKLPITEKLQTVKGVIAFVYKMREDQFWTDMFQ